MTGAVVVLCQTIASSVASSLATKNLTLLYILAVVCCSLAAFVVNAYDTAGDPANSRRWASDPCTQPLLSPPASIHDPTSPVPLGFMRTYSDRWQEKPSRVKIVLKLLGFVFLLAAVAKATRPLFITYIQHRVGITPDGVSEL